MCVVTEGRMGFFFKIGKKSHLNSIGNGAEFRPLRTPKKSLAIIISREGIKKVPFTLRLLICTFVVHAQQNQVFSRQGPYHICMEMSITI